ncbi:hypothetical protein AB870_14770 [Pandoraea faecigallinarum]|uniref:Uncharacterized protein n=1 Tax=Pandoraea faecigallinarum TaxID=656179 RepID=A0A0H3WWW5_9BURK|nr:hypothetical protein [Pandoraea faecigallinarum]AKM31113.1 hypothetical protein AB870_14770 [Pandoraea faecigallinarum]
MKTRLSPLIRFCVSATATVCLLAPVPPSEAAGRDGRGAHARGHGGGNAGQHTAQRQNAGNRQPDARTRNVRNTSVNNVNNVNNVNVNRNVNVNVDNHGGYYHGGWDDDYHPVATAAAVTAAVGVTAAVVGSVVHSVPANCVPVNYRGMIYQQCGNTWYQPQGTQFIVVNPPY